MSIRRARGVSLLILYAISESIKNQEAYAPRSRIRMRPGHFTGAFNRVR